MSKSSRNTTRLNRRPSSREPGKIFLIVPEGKKTEPNYFLRLREIKKLHISRIIVMNAEGTDPVSLLQKACEERKKREQEAKNDPSKSKFDEVWIVYDLEKTHDERRIKHKEARASKDAKGVQFAVSDPCFEYWLLLHQTDTTKGFADADAVVKELKKSCPEYSKDYPFPDAFFEDGADVEKLGNVKKAINCAARHRKQREERGEPECAPLTDVDKLVGSILSPSSS